MIKKILLIYIFLIFAFTYSITNTYFCDGYIEGRSCSTGSMLENIDNLNNFSSNYTNINLGYLGNKFNSFFSDELGSSIGYFGNKFNSFFSDELGSSIGYFGNKFTKNFSDQKWSSIGFLGTKRTVESPFHQVPVGVFGIYKNQILSFQDHPKENNFLSYPLIKYVSENPTYTPQGVGSNVNSCSIPSKVSSVKIEIKNNGLLDYVNISWQNTTGEKIKIIKISPEYKEYLIDTGKSSFEDFSLTPDSSYSYFIVVYNDCYNSGFYSDALTIKYYGKSDEGKIYLTLLNNELLLNIPSNIEVNSNINLRCEDLNKTIINDSLNNNKYVIDFALLKGYFSCVASFFDKKGDYYKSEIYVNKPNLNKYISEKEALDFIYIGDSSNLVFNDLYLNVSKIDNSAYLTYAKASLYLSNIIFQTYLSNENLSFDIFSDLGLFKTGISKTDKITEKDFIDLVLFIENDLSKNKKNFISFINTYFGYKKYNLVLKEIDKVFLINKYLKDYKRIDKNKFDVLNNCISHVSCSDTSILKSIDKEIDLTSNKTQEFDIKNYKDYINLLYFEAGYSSYIKKGYSEENYKKLINIIVESLTYGTSFYDKDITYSSFQNLQYEVMFYDKLMINISLLTEKYLDKIILIYNTSKKEDLLGILKDFLSIN
nr:hypothetical protein [Candidatus Gracilibacteria bacterium]